MKLADLMKTDALLALLPVLLAWLWVLLSPQMLPADIAAYSAITPFWTLAWQSTLLYLPLLLAQGWLSLCLQPIHAAKRRLAIALLWLGAFVLYPAGWWTVLQSGDGRRKIRAWALRRKHAQQRDTALITALQ